MLNELSRVNSNELIEERIKSNNDLVSLLDVEDNYLATPQTLKDIVNEKPKNIIDNIHERQQIIISKMDDDEIVDGVKDFNNEFDFKKEEIDFIEEVELSDNEEVIEKEEKRIETFLDDLSNVADKQINIEKEEPQIIVIDTKDIEDEINKSLEEILDFSSDKYTVEYKTIENNIEEDSVVEPEFIQEHIPEILSNPGTEVEIVVLEEEKDPIEDSFAKLNQYLNEAKELLRQSQSNVDEEIIQNDVPIENFDVMKSKEVPSFLR